MEEKTPLANSIASEIFDFSSKTNGSKITQIEVSGFTYRKLRKEFEWLVATGEIESYPAAIMYIAGARIREAA